ncbi:MAG: hypothetical protein KDD62_06505, partial [Bdellovibrionales bacterium]|nr:hypothetical protein [Bdellovibrionales bacterium]
MRTNASGVQRAASEEALEGVSALREAAFEYLLENRPGDLPHNAASQSLDSLKLRYPNAEDSRYIVSKLANFAEGFAACFPDLMRERADLFEPALTVPTAQDILQNPNVALESLRSFRAYVPNSDEFQKQFKSLIEDVEYVVHSSTRGILGLGEGSSTEFTHVLITLDSASRSSLRKLGVLKDVINRIQIPEPKIELPEREKAIEGDDKAKIKTAPIVGDLATSALGVALGAIWKFVRARYAAFQAWKEKGMKSIGDSLGQSKVVIGDTAPKVLKAIGKAMWYGVVAVTSPIWVPIVGTALGYRGARHVTSVVSVYLKDRAEDGQGVVGGTCNLWKRGWENHPGKMMLGVGALGTAAFGYMIQQGLGLAGIRSSDVFVFGSAAGVVLTTIAIFAREGVRKVFGNIGEGIERGALTPARDAWFKFQKTQFYYKYFAKGLKRESRGFYDGMGRSVTSYFKKSQQRSAQDTERDEVCKVISADDDFWGKLSVLDVHLIEGKGGKIVSLNKFLQEKASEPEHTAQVEALKKSFYRTTEFRAPALEEVTQDETSITMGVRSGKVALVTPVGYEISGICFRGPVIDEETPATIITDCFPVSVDECVFGSATVNVPIGAHSVEYRIRRGSYSVSAKQIESFHRLLGGVEAYKGIEGESFQEAMEAFDFSKEDQMKLLYQHQLDRGFKIVKDSFLRTFVNSSGDAVAESIGGLRLAGKDALSYYSTAMYNANGIPAILLSGVLPNKSSGTFDIAGHSQTAVLTEKGTLICDLANQVQESQGTSASKLRLFERFSVLRRLWGMSFKQVFNYASEIREIVTQPKQELGFFQQFMVSLYEFGKRSIPFVRRRYSESSSRYVSTDFDRMQLPPERRVVDAIAAKLATNRTIAEARADRSFNQVAYFYKDNPEMPKLY